MDLSNVKALTAKILSYIKNEYAKKEDIPKVTNDLTDELKDNYDSAYVHSQIKHAPYEAEKNKIDSITINNVKMIPDNNKNINITIPQSELSNDDIIKAVESVISEIESTN